MRYTSILFGFAILLAGCVKDGLRTDLHPPKSRDFKSFKDRAPPELISLRSHWVNADGVVTLKQLEGKVVWLQFNFSENCTPLRRHLAKWQDDFEGDGLVIIEIGGGRYEELDTVKRSVEAQEAKHLVLWDEGDRNHRRYGIRSWPAAFLIGRNGRVLWEGTPSKAVLAEMQEQTIIDKRTGRQIRDLVVEALSDSSQCEIFQRQTET